MTNNKHAVELSADNYNLTSKVDYNAKPLTT